MNKRFDKQSEFLSTKTIFWLSLAISVGVQLLFVVSFYFGESFMTPFEKHGPHRLKIDRVLVNLLTSFIQFFVLFWYNRKIVNSQIRNANKKILILISGSILITIVLSVLTSFLPVLLYDKELKYEALIRMMRGGLMRDLSFMVIVILTTQLLHSLYEQKNIAVENESLRAENISTRYETLKSQLNPHFLFNSLNTLQSLIDVDKEKSQEYIQQLSFVLRNTLQNKEVVTLDEELKCVKAYCGLVQIRYGENLHFDFQIDESFMDYQILPLTLQGLVENAIKHNVISDKQPLTVTLQTLPDAQVKVSNAIQKKYREEKSSGIGLYNLSERYRLMWDKTVLISNDEHSFEVTVPIIKP